MTAIMVPVRVFTGSEKKPTPPSVVEAALSTLVPFVVAEIEAPEERSKPLSTPEFDWNSALVITKSVTEPDTS